MKINNNGNTTKDAAPPEKEPKKVPNKIIKPVVKYSTISTVIIITLAWKISSRQKIVKTAAQNSQ